MKRFLTIGILVGYSGVSEPQSAQLEVDGVFGECMPVWAAIDDELKLYREPNLEAESRAFRD